VALAVWSLLSVAVFVLAVTLQTRDLNRLPPSNIITEDERVAASLANGRGWTDAYARGTGPTAHLAPLYPLMLSAIYRIFGTYETLSGRQAQAGLAIVAAALSLVVLPLLARRLNLSPVAGWASAFGVAMLPTTSWSEVIGSHEQPLATLTLLSLVGVLAILQQDGWTSRRAIGSAGLMIAVAALLCPNLLLVPALFLAVEWICRTSERRQILRSGVAITVISLSCIVPWAVRNYLVLGGFVPLRSNFGLELAVGNRPGANGHTYEEGFRDVHPFSSTAERARLVEMGEIAYMADKRSQALAWIVNHPGEFARLTGRRAWLFWFGPDERWYRAKCSTRLRLAAAMGLTAGLGLVRLLRRGHSSGRLLTCALLGIAIPYFVTHVEARYRLPVVGLFALLSCDLAVASMQATWSKVRATVHGVFDRRGGFFAWSGMSTAQ
jgi:hypothetical protein